MWVARKKNEERKIHDGMEADLLYLCAPETVTKMIVVRETLL